MENAVNMTRLNGVDNPAVTNDEGVNTRPDLVISIQPQSHAGNRAELPVTTVDWHSNPRGQFIPTNGLDFLIGVSRLLIQQTIELNDLTSKIDSENRYIIRVPHGEALYIASEVSSKSERCLCGTGRSFTMHLHDNTRQEALLLKRRLAAASCCFPCRLQDMKVITPPGDYVGRIQQRWTWVVPFYLVRDGNDDVVFVVEGPAVMKRSALLLSEFKIMTGDSLREVGKISHGWDRDLNSFATTLQFPDAAVQPKHKALLLATTFLLSWITMVHQTCTKVCTLRKKTWPYHEYYTGAKDEEKRKSAQGSNHWTGPKSIEWFTGSLLRDTMHGAGEYRWRHTGDESTSFTYEGNFYCNKMHGYGTMSYPDGRVFTGFFHSNLRWGPGKESHACLHEDVGLWCGRQLVRLVWRPATPSVAPDLNTGVGKACVDLHRVMLTESYKKIGETNSALDLLKQFGSDPRVAAEKWKKLYPKNCTDLASPLCHVEVFEHNYYNGKVHFLQEVSVLPENKDFSQDDNENPHNLTTYYAWNNTRSSIHMMQHCFTHDSQRNPDELNLADILCGPRKLFRPAGQHEVDCRTLLMACYLGHTSNVVKLVNDCNILPDIADGHGNTAVIYATCGDQADIINFLVEAGAIVDNLNDSCCTPLGIALVRFMCAQKEIAPSGMLQALLPPPLVPAPPPVEQKVFEWNFNHDQAVSLVAGGLTRTPSKMSKALPGTKRIKSSQSLKDLPNTRKKTDATSAPKPDFLEHSSNELVSEDQKLFNEINSEFAAKVNELFLLPSGANSVSYLFEINDMIKEIETSDEDPKKQPDKNPRKVISKVLKETMKPSKELMWQSTEKDDLSSVNSSDRKKAEMIAQMMLTILQLLSDGANPGLVKCPQPALFIAIISGCPDLVKHLVNYGADINEVYNETFGYTPLDLAVSRQFTYENMELIRTILESGAITSHRLRYGELSSSTGSVVSKDGPSLLHAVLARKTESELEKEIRRNVLEILLKFNCSPLVRFKGHSAIEVAMTKSMDVFDIFIRSPTTSLNVPINDSNQSVLVKMFSFPFFKTIMPSERLQTLTNLLLFGADPLLECVNGEDEYSNVFVFALKTLSELEASQSKSNAVPSPNKSESRKAPPAPKKEQLSTKSLGKLGMDDVGDYKQAIDLVTECARLLHVRWLQAKLVKELVDIINRYKHRQWNMIMKEHKHKKKAGLWLTPQRCLEIWDILKLTRRKVYSDGRVLKHLLHIVLYYNRLQRFRPTTQPTTEEKNSVEYTVYYLLKERVTGTKLTTDLGTCKKPYVKPELTSRAAEAKFKICFECALPLDHEGIQCVSCKLVAFCTFGCMKNNIERVSCHPCSGYLKDKYFTSPSESGTQNII